MNLNVSSIKEMYMNKKIIFILYSLSVGGAERRAASIANYLVNNGFEIEVLLLDNAVVKFKTDKNITIKYLPDIPKRKNCVSQKLYSKAYKLFSKNHYNEYDFLMYLRDKYSDRIYDYLKNKKGYTIISWMTLINLSTCYALKSLKNDLILVECTSPELEYPDNHPAQQLKRKLYSRAKKIICQTHEAARYYGILRETEKCVIPNPIIGNYPDRFTGVRKKVIVTFSRLSKEKNISLLIDAFCRLHADYKEYRLHIFGEGAEKEKLIDYVYKLEMDNSIIFFDFDINLHETIKDYAMFVSASNREGMSNSMLESMAIGLPTIVTDCGGAPKMLIENYKNGIVVPTNDKDALYDAMKYIVDHPIETETMSINATNIRNSLSIDRIGQEWIKAITD